LLEHGQVTLHEREHAADLDPEVLVRD